jgi:hypothetical protein
MFQFLFQVVPGGRGPETCELDPPLNRNPGAHRPCCNDPEDGVNFLRRGDEFFVLLSRESTDLRRRFPG